MGGNTETTYTFQGDIIHTYVMVSSTIQATHMELKGSHHVYIMFINPK
jgi:hypothetical protein